MVAILTYFYDQGIYTNGNRVLRGGVIYVVQYSQPTCNQSCGNVETVSPSCRRDIPVGGPIANILTKNELRLGTTIKPRTAKCPPVLTPRTFLDHASRWWTFISKIRLRQFSPQLVSITLYTHYDWSSAHHEQRVTFSL